MIQNAEQCVARMKHIDGMRKANVQSAQNIRKLIQRRNLNNVDIKFARMIKWSYQTLIVSLVMIISKKMKKDHGYANERNVMRSHGSPKI